MVLGLADMRHLELARAVPGHQRAVMFYSQRIFGERPQFHRAAHAMRGADTRDANLRGHQRASSFETRRRRRSSG
jgi:hypothetical protein